MRSLQRSATQRCRELTARAVAGGKSSPAGKMGHTYVKPWATPPPCTLGSSHNSNRQEKELPLHFLASRQSQSPFPPMRGNDCQAGAASLPAISPPASFQLCRKRAKANYGTVLEPKILQGTKTKCFEVPGTQLNHCPRCIMSNPVSPGMQCHCKAAILPK